MKRFITFCLLIFAGFTGTAFAQKNGPSAELRNKIEGQRYTFKATYAIPLRGGEKYLTSDYDVRITKDSVIAFLPYFGRVYMNPPMTPEENGIEFTATKFSYKAAPAKKGGWTITITPQNIKYVSKMILDVYNNGSAMLLVTSNFRDQISFQGNIKQ